MIGVFLLWIWAVTLSMYLCRRIIFELSRLQNAAWAIASWPHCCRMSSSWHGSLQTLRSIRLVRDLYRRSPKSSRYFCVFSFSLFSPLLSNQPIYLNESKKYKILFHQHKYSIDLWLIKILHLNAVSEILSTPENIGKTKHAKFFENKKNHFFWFSQENSINQISKTKCMLGWKNWRMLIDRLKAPTSKKCLLPVGTRLSTRFFSFSRKNSAPS